MMAILLMSASQVQHEKLGIDKRRPKVEVRFLS